MHYDAPCLNIKKGRAQGHNKTREPINLTTALLLSNFKQGYIYRVSWTIYNAYYRDFIMNLGPSASLFFVLVIDRGRLMTVTGKTNVQS